MNLGDGLLFQLENGKPRLVLAKYGAESKSSNPQKSSKSSCQIPAKKKSQRIMNSEHGLSQPERHKQDKKCRDTPSISYMAQNIADGNRKTINTGRSESRFRGIDRIQSERNGNDSSTATNQNLVCLTQKQFQQILSTINNTKTNNLQTHTAKPVASSEEISPTATTAKELFLCGNNDRPRVEEKKKDTEPLSHIQQSGLFSTFGEREREAVEQRKTEWRRELDEQMALKRKQNGSMKSYDKLREGTLKAQADIVHDLGTSQTPTRTENSNPKAQIQTHRPLPAAIRSAFIPGEAAPLDNAFSAQRAEQQRQWLQELDQQREEAKLRRQREKEIDCQAEDIDRWAVHFDSLRQASAVAADHREPNMSSCLSHQRSISRELSTAWEGISVHGGENLGRANVETTLDNQQRTSHLRTMTALLDPAQIEERERRRLKEVEHQEAVKAQVEERKRQRENEEATQRAREEEEEKRVERERERLQEQFMKDTERQRNREELHVRKTEELYLSIQRAQEEAFKDKHLQRIKDLAKKGHDVSRLLRSLEGDSVSQDFSGQESPDTSTSLMSSEGLINKVEPTTAPSPRKDIAVQTVCDPEKPYAEVTHTAPPNTLTSRNSQLNKEKLAERSHGTENMYTAPTEAEADPYEPYARTSRNGKQQPRKKPEWNMQRPSKAFIPASERYPEALQRHRQKSRKHRQMELMMLVEKNTVSQTPQQDLPPQPIRSIAQKHKNTAQKQSENQLQEPSAFTSERVSSPSVPAVKNLLKQSTHHMIEKYAEDTGCPPSLDYVPYVRTDEVYHMDPMAPLSRPSTHETQQRFNMGSRSRQATPLVQHDPSHKGTERQQAILRGLSELRQGLLQKQREIESSLNPLLQTQQKNVPPFRPV